ncbi:unnamed protein product [Closterium sp. NIES-54]
MSLSLELNQHHHVMHLLSEVDCGPKAWTVLKELHALTSVVATLMLEKRAVRVALERGRAGALCFGQNARPLREVGDWGNHLPGANKVFEHALAAAGIVALIHERIEPAVEPELLDARVGADEDSGGRLPSPPTEAWRRRQQRLRDAREPT